MDGSLNPQHESIENIAQPTHNERARQRFVSSLRKRVMVDMAQSLRRAYEHEVLPAFKQAAKRPPRDGREIRRAMLELSLIHI